MLMALASGLVLGGGVAFGREFLDRSVHDARGLQNEFEVPVLARFRGSTRLRASPSDSDCGFSEIGLGIRIRD